MKLNIGCGRNILEGWINVDQTSTSPEVVIADLEDLEAWWKGGRFLDWQEDTCEEFLLSHVLEHVSNVLPLMQTLWRVAKPGALLTARVPYGSSDDADEDPTHVRRFFVGSWGYFGQPHYWRADYGYAGDWECRRITLHLRPECGPATKETASDMIMSERNVVREMVAELRACKPAREPRAELQSRPEIMIMGPQTPREDK